MLQVLIVNLSQTDGYHTTEL